MKRVVCREDIIAEMQMLSQLQADMSFIKAQLGMLQDRLDFLEQKSSVINSMNTAVNVPIRTGDEPHNYWGEAISNATRRIRQDGHWNMDDDGTLTFVTD